MFPAIIIIIACCALAGAYVRLRVYMLWRKMLEQKDREIKARKELERLHESRYQLMLAVNQAQGNSIDALNAQLRHLVAHIQKLQGADVDEKADWWKNGGRPPVN